jgi:hypothetical protein
VTPASIRIGEIVSETLNQSEKYTRKRLAVERYNLSRKDLKSLRERTKIASRLSVLGEAQVLVDGQPVKRTVRLWDVGPGWWNQAAVDQRRAWLLSYFARQLQVEPSQIISVRFTI